MSRFGDLGAAGDEARAFWTDVFRDRLRGDNLTTFSQDAQFADNALAEWIKRWVEPSRDGDSKVEFPDAPYFCACGWRGRWRDLDATGACPTGCGKTTMWPPRDEVTP